MGSQTSGLQYWCWLFFWFIVGSNGQTACTQTLINQTLNVSCPVGSTMETFDIDNLTMIDTIEKLKVMGIDGRGPLRFIPENICRFTRLQELDLSFNRIINASFQFTSPCLSQLERLDLSYNNLSEVPDAWISQMPKLKIINFAGNQLISIPSRMFYNISNIEQLDVYSNNLATLELWLLQIKTLITYSKNPVTRFTNHDSFDLSKYQSTITTTISLNNGGIKIDVDDSIFEIYNRCAEVNSTYTPFLKQAIAIIDTTYPGLLNWKCSCAQYYLREYVESNRPGNDFSKWICPDGPNITYHEMCSSKTSFNVTNIEPRLCKINQCQLNTTCEHVEPPNFLSNTSNLEEISLRIYEKLNNVTLLNNRTVREFAEIIKESDNKLQSDISLIITKLVQTNFQQIISHIEDLIALINTPIYFPLGSVAILSLWKNSSINLFSQIRRNQTYFNYYTEINSENSTTTITIDRQSIENLSSTDIYTFYYLPSSLFQFAQEDQNIIIVSPIVGVHLPNNSPRLINMSFIDVIRPSGRYSCVFWQSNQWNDTGCSHSMDFKSNRHFCLCNHTTSFALIFIPHKTIHQTYIPSITIAILSIICFCISIILSIYRQATCFRHLSITNIFTLSNSIMLFILLTVILIQGYQSNEKINNHCSKTQENLVLTTYFFLISTFASKTFLGICYFLTIFFHFIFIQFTAISNKWFYTGFLLVILIALIPTIIISVILKQWKDFFLQYQGICWLNSSVIFRFISIPIIIFIGLNILIISGITIRLFQFSCRQKPVKTNEKRMIISMMIWLALCVSLGIAWIFGPFLDVLIKDKDQTSSVIKLWFFGIFIGLEGVWVLIVNVIFYVNQKVNKKNRQMFLNKNKK